MTDVEQLNHLLTLSKENNRKQVAKFKQETERLTELIKLQHVMFQLADAADDDQKVDKWRKVHRSPSLATKICGNCAHAVDGEHCSSCVDSAGNACDSLFSCFTPLFELGVPTLGVCKLKRDYIIERIPVL